MAALYADEDFPRPVIDELTRLGHDILTAASDGRANRNVPDADVLVRATALGRAVLTQGHDFSRLHKLDPSHAGIVWASVDTDFAAEAARIDAAVHGTPVLAGTLIRVYLPNPP